MMSNRPFKKQLWIVVMVVLGTTAACSQTPVEISLLNESTGIPFSGAAYCKPLHPGMEVSTGIPRSGSKHHNAYFMVSFKLMFHKHLFKAWAICAGFGYDYRLDFGMNLKSGMSIGYLHTFSTGEEHKFMDGMYVNLPDRGNARFTTALSLGLGYRFRPPDPNSAEVFVKRQYWLEIPYSPGFIPLLPHINSVVGAKFY